MTELQSARFPRGALMLEITAIAGVLRQAATDLEELAGAAHTYELSTLRRKMRGIVAGALALAEGFTPGAEA